MHLVALVQGLMFKFTRLVDIHSVTKSEFVELERETRVFLVHLMIKRLLAQKYLPENKKKAF